MLGLQTFTYLCSEARWTKLDSFGCFPEKYIDITWTKQTSVLTDGCMNSGVDTNLILENHDLIIHSVATRNEDLAFSNSVHFVITENGLQVHTMVSFKCVCMLYEFVFGSRHLCVLHYIALSLRVINLCDRVAHWAEQGECVHLSESP